MKRMEVRCCCTPSRILGWLQVPDHTTAGMTLRYPLLQEMPQPAPGPEIGTTGLVMLEVQKLFGPHTIGTAIKSMHLPIETLRLIPGFEENKE